MRICPIILLLHFDDAADLALVPVKDHGKEITFFRRDPFVEGRVHLNTISEINKSLIFYRLICLLTSCLFQEYGHFFCIEPFSGFKEER